MTRHDPDQLTRPGSSESREADGASRGNRTDIAVWRGGCGCGCRSFRRLHVAKRQLDHTEARIRDLQAEKASLQQIKSQVDAFESQKAVLQQRIDVIETLQKNRSGAQDLLQMVANTVVRVDALWLTSITRTGDSLDIQGEAGSINSVANFITELKRSGYFTNVEIKDAKENDLRPAVQTYSFSMSVTIAPQQNGAPTTQATGAAQPPPPARKGRS